MKIIKYILLLLLITSSISASNYRLDTIIKNTVKRQEVILNSLENYFINSTFDYTKINPYEINRAKLSLNNLGYVVFKNLSNEDCINDGDYCTSDIGGLEFKILEKNNKYYGVKFLDSDVFGSNCPFCHNKYFFNNYKNNNYGNRIKYYENTIGSEGFFYPFKRKTVNLFNKFSIYVSLYGSNISISKTAPTDTTKIWIDISNDFIIEKVFTQIGSKQEWININSLSKEIFVANPLELVKLPKINGMKIKVINDNSGKTAYYGYHENYEINCSSTIGDVDYNELCGWTRVITGFDDYDFAVKGL